MISSRNSDTGCSASKPRSSPAFRRSFYLLSFCFHFGPAMAQGYNLDARSRENPIRFPDDLGLQGRTPWLPCALLKRRTSISQQRAAQRSAQVWRRTVPRQMSHARTTRRRDGTAGLFSAGPPKAYRPLRGKQAKAAAWGLFWPFDERLGFNSHAVNRSRPCSYAIGRISGPG